MNTEKSTIKKILQTIRLGRALGLVWNGARGWTLASGALMLLQSVLPLFSLYLMKLVVDAITAGMKASDPAGAFSEVWFLIIVTSVVALVEAICRSLSRVVQEQQTQVISDFMHDTIHAQSIAVDLEYYENPKYYDAMHRAQREGPIRPSQIVNGLFQVGQSTLSLLAIAGLLISFHWAIAVLLFLAALPGLMVRLKFADRLYLFQRDWTGAERQAWYIHLLLTAGQYAKEVRLFGFGPLFMDWFKGLRKTIRKEKLKLTTRRAIAEGITQTVPAFAVLGAFAFIAYRTVLGGSTLGDLVMYYQAFQRGQGFIQQLMTGLSGLYENNLFLANLYEFLDLKPELATTDNAQPVPEPLKKGIVFENVSFQYPTGTRPVLKGIDLTIAPGEVVALVGENGSGKTTLIKLLCRFYDPDQGRITLDEVDLRRFETAKWQRQISVIFQDYVQYHLTVRENIWLGNIDIPLESERIEEAAKKAGADRVIEKLPEGYDTMLGKFFDRGEELSIGEWQKISLARAFLDDAQLLVLDEPTSSMDARAEYEVFQKYRDLARNRSVVLISHRFSTVKMADRIFVLEDGRISESGSHEQLVALGGTYAQLFEIQAENYR